MTRLIVLLGAPGSGKTSVGEALAQHHEEVLAWIRSDPAPCAIESTGLSDRDWIDELRHLLDTVVVRLDVDEPTAIGRMRTRPPGRHLTDDSGLQHDVWTAFQELAAPAIEIDLVLDTTQVGPDDAAEIIVERFVPEREPER